jgi:hypothetical protein
MRILEGIIDNKKISIIYEGTGLPSYMRVEILSPRNIVVCDKIFANPIMLSASFVSEVGYGPACDFLHNHDIPKESQLWHLNHSGFSPKKSLDLF